MSGVIFALAVAVWLVALYAFVRIAVAWLGVVRLAPTGQKFAAALDLGFWNFPSVERRIGAGGAVHIAAYRHGFLVFVVAFAAFMVLVLVNIFSGNAA